MSQREWIAAAIAGLVVVLLAVLVLYAGDAPVEEAPVAEKSDPPVTKPRPRPSAPRPARSRDDLAVAAPGNQPPVSTEAIPQDVKTEFNYAMRDAVKEARLQCVNPWLQSLGDEKPPAATFIMDAVVTDGALTDIALRGIGEIPEDVADCARDAAWAVAWPDFQGKGEVRFQETFTTTGQEP